MQGTFLLNSLSTCAHVCSPDEPRPREPLPSPPGAHPRHFERPSADRPAPVTRRRAQMKPAITWPDISIEQSIEMPSPASFAASVTCGGGGGTAPVGLYHVVTFVCTL